MWKSFWGNVSGNFAVTFGVLVVPLMGAVGLAVDYSAMHSAKSHLQDVADAAALAATKELALSTTTKSDVISVAESYVSIDFNTQKTASDYVKVSTVVADDRSEVTVDLAYYWRPFIAQYMDNRMLPIRVKATAARAGSEPMCVLSLEGSGRGRLDMRGKGSLDADGCTVHVNSNDKDAIALNKNATMSALNIYTAGGYNGSNANFSPLPIVDSPVMEDPLADRIAPQASHCLENNLKIIDKTVTLYPGTYCGGIDASGTVDITLRPGIYIFKDGPLSLGGKGVFEGDYVSLVFEGDKSTMDIGPSMTVSLKAPKDGATSGIIIFEDRNASPGHTFAIRSKNAERMEGAIYLPRGKLFVDKASRVGQASKWSAIIAREIEVGDGPQIQINSDYGGSDIPAPEGVKGTNHRIYLTN